MSMYYKELKRNKNRHWINVKIEFAAKDMDNAMRELRETISKENKEPYLIADQNGSTSLGKWTFIFCLKPTRMRDEN